MTVAELKKQLDEHDDEMEVEVEGIGGMNSPLSRVSVEEVGDEDFVLTLCWSE